MYTKKQLRDRAEKARESGDLELAGMLEDYVRLKFSYIPQILEKVEATNSKGQLFPHTCRVKCADSNKNNEGD